MVVSPITASNADCKRLEIKADALAPAPALAHTNRHTRHQRKNVQ